MRKVLNLNFDVSVIAVIVPITFLIVWFALDRDPPYVRISGEIVAADPADCQLEQDAPRGIAPGACVSPVWKVRAIRQCDPAPGYPVSRWLVQSTGNRVSIGSAKSEYPQQAAKPGGTAPLHRVLVLPYNTPEGRTIYESQACFTCNPLQRLIPSLFAVCVSEPNIEFTVDRSPPRTDLLNLHRRSAKQFTPIP